MFEKVHKLKKGRKKMQINLLIISLILKHDPFLKFQVPKWIERYI